MNKVLQILLYLLLFDSVSAQSINTEFGKNRVQFHDDFNNWWQYETENFNTYWYGKARFIAQPTLQMAEMDHDEIQKVMEHRMNDKIEIIVYVDISDLKQSNIGTEETFTNKTGETKIVGNKMFVYFDGDHNHLRLKIREGIATVYLNNMLFGTNIQEVIQNAVLLNIPDWYKQGIVAYASSNWNYLIEDELRDIWQRNKKNHDFSKLAEQHPKVAGHSFWFYIDQNYGKSAISNLLYLTKISRGIDNSFEYVLNTNLTTLKQEWKSFYTQYYASEKNKFDPKSSSKELKLQHKKYVPVSNLKLSPDGNELLYAYNDQGKFKIMVRDLKTDEQKQVFKYGYKNVFQETDYNYPLMAWHPNKPEITYIFEHRDVIKLVKYRLDTGEKMEQIIPGDFQRLYSLSYVDDFKYILSASTDGLSDLIRYNSKNRNFEKITDDFFDDLDAEYTEVLGQKGILFSSNRTKNTLEKFRPDTLLPLDKFDLFFLPDGAKELNRLTYTTNINERYPYMVTADKMVFAGDGSGMINTYCLDIKEDKIFATSDLDRNLIRHHAVPGSSTYVSTYYTDGMYKVFRENLDLSAKYEPFITQSARASKKEETAFIPFDPKNISEPIEINEGYKFQTTFPDSEETGPIIGNEQTKTNDNFQININTPIALKPVEPYNHNRAIAANNKFALNNITTKLDNDILFEGLESYTGDRQQLLTTPMGFLIKANVKDLFEDYTLEGGMRIPTNFNGSEYFMLFDNKKSRIDKRFALYRKTNSYNTDNEQSAQIITKSKKTSLLGLYQMKFPFDIYRSIRGTASLRLDRFLALSTESKSFNAKLSSEKRISVKLEYIYDNTHDASLNIKNGTRYKFFVEGINEFDLQLIDGFSFDASKGLTGIFGFDARHYIPVLNKSVLALRASGATSVGSKKMLYFIGGIENWITPKFDNSIPVREDASFAYKVNAFNLRGFDNNIRNGATFVVTNAELRIPFMQYLLGKNKGASFFRYMQLTGFFDAGLAWHGPSPYSAVNPLNKFHISSPPLLELEIEYFRDPLVMGYGVGFRTQLLGYFVKCDYAWGIETRKVQNPKLYLSFGVDF
jgi:hypothetical protein